MSNELVLSNDESNSFRNVLADIKKWCSENQLAIGVGEIAIGASLIAWGVHNGAIEMGTQLVATELGGPNVEALAGAAGGSGLGVIAGSIIGSIGVAGMGGAIGIPAALVIGGAATVFALFGYTAGDISHVLANPPLDIGGLAANGSIFLLGVSLIIDGARRCIKDDSVSSALASFNENIISLRDLSADIVATTMDELNGFIEELKKLPEDKVDASITASSATVGAVGGAVAGGTIAAGSVTVLGSSALGGAAISLGIVSAPLWPVIAGIAGGAGLGYAAYKAVKYWGSSSKDDIT